MKNLRYLIAFAIGLAVTGVANADRIDFQMNVLDPPPGGTLLTSDIFTVVFSPCSAFSHPSAPATLPADAACFEGINATTGGPGGNGEVWTSLVITFADPGQILGLASCGTLGGPGIFAIVKSCTEVGNTFTIAFGGGGSISQGQSFFIAEEGISADSFPTGAAVFSSTPEPSSVLLMSTGVAMFGMLLYSERRKLRLPTRS